MKFNAIPAFSLASLVVIFLMQNTPAWANNETESHTVTKHTIIERGNNAEVQENARENKELWNDTRKLRRESIEDDREAMEHARQLRRQHYKDDKTRLLQKKACDISSNIFAYWEPETLRCLDRQTGKTIIP